MALETDCDSTQENHRRRWRGRQTWLISPEKIRVNAEIHEAYVGDGGIEGLKARREFVVMIREVERKDEGSGSMAIRGKGGDEDG